MTNKNHIFKRMRRPLFFCAACLVAVAAAGYYGLPDSRAAGPPDKTVVTLTGRVCRKDETSFLIQIRGSLPGDEPFSDEAAVPRQDNPTDDPFSENLSEYLSKQLSEYMKSADKMLCEYDTAQDPAIGAVVTVRGEFYAFSRATNPGEFDYARHYHAMGYAGRLRNVEILARDGGGMGVGEGLYRLRCFWKERLYRIFPEKEASVMTAILLGDKTDLDADIKNLYQRTGIIHILSISGLHITLIGMGLYKLLRKLGVPAWLAAAGGGVFLLLYGIMTGLAVSACRAIGMYLLRMLAQIAGRTYDMLTALGVTAAVMVCIHPAWLEHMGFLMSFASILGVGVLLPALSCRGEDGVRPVRYVAERWKRRLIKFRDTLWKGFRQSFLAGMSITLTTLPIQLWFTYEVPVYSVLLNILILPFMGAVAAAGLLAMLIPGMGFVGTADVVILAGYEGVCGVFDQLPHALWNPGRPQIGRIVPYYLLWGIAVWGARVMRRYRKQIAKSRGLYLGIKCGQFVLLAAAVWVIGSSGRHGDRVTFLDVGQGDCVCVRLSSGETYLFDCGSSSRSHVGERVLIPFLKYYGIGRIDAVFLSHADLDHVNGILEILSTAGEKSIEVGQIVLPGIERTLWQEEFGEILAAVEEANSGYADSGRAIPVTVIRAGESWTAGGGAVGGGAAGGGAGDAQGREAAEDFFLCLHPTADGSGGGGNEGSECFYIELREGENALSLLLTGDVEKNGESALLAELRKRRIRDVTVFKVPHHGSKNSALEELLEQIRPTLSVISCGRNNRYGHPHEELLERLERSGTTIRDTPHDGAITVELRERGARVECFLGDG